MPNIPRRRCSIQNCPHPAQLGGKCAQHRRATPRWKGGTPNRTFYRSSTWHDLRAQVLDEERICRGWPPSPSPCYAPTTQVDHVIPIEDGGPELERTNLQALCQPCHSRKTYEERGGIHQ